MSETVQQTGADEIETWVAKLTEMVHAHYAEHYPNQHARSPVAFDIQRLPSGRVRIVKKDSAAATHGSAYCFIDPESGDIFKPDGFKRPAKHARGNIRGENPLAGCGPNGVATFR